MNKVYIKNIGSQDEGAEESEEQQGSEQEIKIHLIEDDPEEVDGMIALKLYLYMA